MRSPIRLCVVLLFAGLGLFSEPVLAFEPPDQPPKERIEPSFRVVGYLPEYRVASFDPDAAKRLTDLVWFSAVPSPIGEAGLDKIKLDSLKLLKNLKEKHGVRIHVCLGGWGRSKGFAELAASADARKKLIEQVGVFCRKHGFDGVDVDWEHPNTAKERKDHAVLLAEMKKSFESDRLRLTMAVAGWQEILPDAVKAVDGIHLMAYDAKGRHSTYEFAESEIERMLKKDIPPDKLCLGVPFYGRGIEKADESVTFAQIVKKHHPKADVDEVDGMYFNGPKMIERKTKLALERKLAGVMIWEVGQDSTDDDSLLQATPLCSPSAGTAPPGDAQGRQHHGSGVLHANRAVYHQVEPDPAGVPADRPAGQ